MPHDENDPRPWDVLASHYVSRKPWLTLRQDRVRLPNGALIDDYYVLEYPDWVNVLALTTEGLVVLVRQYRHGLRAVHYELPGGVCDPTDAGPEGTARRELLEETGYGGGDWSPLATLSANPASHANRAHTFLARGVTRLQDPQPEATEEIHVHLAEPEEVGRILAAGGIVQALHAAPLWQFLHARRG
jgi:8-oxo-dGTP pyrophosphatase MutT (NUDIX family)